MVNDGSTDLSEILCNQAAGQDSRVTVLHQHNQGVSAARNAGIELCKSEFLVFVDSDDWLDLRCIGILAETMESAQSDIVMCRLQRTKGTAQNKEEEDGLGRHFNKVEGLLYIDQHLPGLMSVPCGKLFRKHLTCGIRFPVGRVHEDEFTIYRYLFNAGRMSIISRRLYFHRVRPGSITQSRLSLPRAKDALDAFMDRGCFFQEKIPELAASTFRHAFVIYWEHGYTLYPSLEREQKKQWLLIGKALHAELKKYPYRLRFQLFFNVFFWLPVSMRNSLFGIRKILRPNKLEDEFATKYY